MIPMRRGVSRHLGTWASEALMVALVLSVAVPAAAQRPSEGRSQDRARLEERIRARMGDIIRERLGLDAQQEEALSALVREYEGRRRALTQEEREARSSLEALTESDTVSEAEAEALLRRIADVRVREAALFQEEQDRMLEILSASQVLELYELRRQIGQRIRAIREGRGGDGRGRRGPPGGGPPGAPGGGWSLER